MDLKALLKQNKLHHTFRITVYNTKLIFLIKVYNISASQMIDKCLMCFDTVGWASGRAYGL